MSKRHGDDDDDDKFSGVSRGERGAASEEDPEERRRRRKGYGSAAALRPRSWIPGLLQSVARVSFGTVKVDLSRSATPRRKYSRGGDDWDDNEVRLNRARVEICRRVAFEPYLFRTKPQVDFAAGLSVGTAEDEMFTPKCRLKIGPHIRLKFFPIPAFQYKFYTKPSPASKYVLQTECDIPFECFRDIGSGEMRKKAYIGVRLRNDVGTGLHLRTNGIEFDEKVDVFGPYGTVRAAVQVDFPTEYPLKREDGPPLKLRINRLSMTIPTP